MNLRRHLAETATLVACAVTCALVANHVNRPEYRLAVLPQAAPTRTRAPRPADPAPMVASSTVSPAPTSAAATPAEPAPRPAGAVPAVPGATTATSANASSRPDPGEARQRFRPHGQPYVEVKGDDVAFLHERGALFLDARRTNVYRDGHVAGARSFPVWESEVVDKRIEALLAEGPDTDAPVVIYCSGGDCEDSHMLAQKLFGAGFNNLLIYKDGWPDWQKRGGKSEKGAGA